MEWAWELRRQEMELAVVPTLHADRIMQAMLVNPGIVGGRLAFVKYGKIELDDLRSRPQLAVAFHNGWRWATVEGLAEWDAYSRTMYDQRRTAVPIAPSRVYGS